MNRLEALTINNECLAVKGKDKGFGMNNLAFMKYWFKRQWCKVVGHKYVWREGMHKPMRYCVRCDGWRIQDLLAPTMEDN